MQTMRVNKWGNSLGIRFPSEFVKRTQIKEKSLVEIVTDGERLIITKLPDEKPRKTIRELFDEYPADFIEDEELDWGGPMGGEIW